MKTARLVLGIISIVLFGLIIFQSCAAGLGNAMAENGESSGSAGIILAVFMLVAGIVGIAARKSFGGAITAAVFYIFGAVIAIPMSGSFADLKIWGVLSAVFGAVFLITAIVQKKKGL